MTIIRQYEIEDGLEADEAVWFSHKEVHTTPGALEEEQENSRGSMQGLVTLFLYALGAVSLIAAVVMAV